MKRLKCEHRKNGKHFKFHINMIKHKKIGKISSYSFISTFLYKYLQLMRKYHILKNREKNVHI